MTLQLIVPASQHPAHLALVTADETEPESHESGPVVTVDSANARQHRDAIEPRGSPMLGLR